MRARAALAAVATAREERQHSAQALCERPQLVCCVPRESRVNVAIVQGLLLLLAETCI